MPWMPFRPVKKEIESLRIHERVIGREGDDYLCRGASLAHTAEPFGKRHLSELLHRLSDEAWSASRDLL